MALNAGNIYVAVKGDLNPLDAALRAARKQSETASKKIKNSFAKIEGAAKKTARSITTGLGGAISGIAMGTLVTQAVALADKYTLLEGRISLVTKSTKELVEIQDELFKISQKTRVGYEATVEIFTRLSRATKGTALSQQDMLKVTESLNKAVIVSGATTQEASNALIQLSQGLASNRLGGEELRSVMEQIPRVGQMIADGLGVTIGKFRELSKQGKLTAEVVTKALLSQSEVIDQEFTKIPVTIAQAWTMVMNSVGRAIDILNESTGATMSLADAMVWLSNVIDSSTSGMARFLDVTISGLKTIAKISAVGGALYLLPIIITKTHEALVLLNFTMFKMQTGVIGLNTSLYGTSVSAQLAAGSLSKMQLAGGALLALFAGWELGKWANENFEEVRLAGLAAVAQLDETWIKFKFNFLQLWIDLRFGASKSLDEISNKVADVFSDIAEKMSGVSFTVANPFGDDFQVGLSSASDKLKKVADNIRNSASATREHEKATSDLREKMDKALEVHEGTVGILIKERTWTKSVSKAKDDAGIKHDKYSETVVSGNNAIIDSTSMTAEKVIAAQDKMYKDLGDMSVEYQDFLFDRLDEQKEKYEKLNIDQNLIDKWYAGEKKKIQDKSAKDTVKLQDTIAKATSSAAEAGAMAWLRGEDAKTAASTVAADILTKNALKAAEEPLRKGLGSLLGEQLGAWVGLGAGESSVEGETWKDRIKNGATYLAQAGAIILAGKAVGTALYAGGGWIGDNPGGGVINKGSGVRDDVFLGFSNGGNVANMGMGGEFVIPRKQTQKHLPLLEAIRTDNFADGGPVGDPKELAHNMNAGGFSTFFTEWINTGNYKEGIKAAIIYYLQTAFTMSAGKEWGGDILNFSGGGVTGIKNFAGGGPVAKKYSGEDVDTNISAQIVEWVEDWTGVSDDLLDPLGIAVGTDDVLEALNSWIGNSNLSVGTGSINDIFKGIYDVEMPTWLDRGMISTSIDTLDRLLLPFATDMLTPGKGHDIPGAIEYQFSDALEESVEQGIKGLIGLDLEDDWKGAAKKFLDPFDIFHDGSSFVQQTGNATVARGERIFSAPDNEEIMDILRGNSSDSVSVNVYPSFKVMIGDEDFTDKVEIITENMIVEREDRGLLGTGERVKF
jgi:tape measure domain-containing protein